jgi:predicted TIM-barrel fold metal-dependent hydrolase
VEKVDSVPERDSLFKLGEQRSFAGLVKLDAATIAAMPKMISTDAHVDEPDELWQQLPSHLYRDLPKVKFGECPPGGRDPHARLLDQIQDGVEAEILFPNYGMILFSVDNIELQREAFHLYNNWLAEFCSVAPKNLIGVPCLSVYDIDDAVAEMHRAHDLGLKGLMVWEVPDPKLPFTSDHYEKLWAAAAEAEAPVHTHILTGHSYAKDFAKFIKSTGIEKIREAVNIKTADATNTLFDFLFSGIFERHPKLKLVLAESEVGWVPFLLQQWDYYFERTRKKSNLPITRKPSELFEEHVYCTFLDDFVGTRAFSHWGERNCMWSNDYPHFNMTFPHSRDNVERHLHGLPDDKRLRLIRDNAIELYKLDL